VCDSVPIAYKDVKNTRYVYFTYWDQEQKKKIEVYCGPTTDPKSLEKAQELEREYLKKQITTLQTQLKEYDTNVVKKPKYRKAKSVNEVVQRNIEAQIYMKDAKLYEPDVYYKTSECMDEVEAESIQLIVTSPPYNVGKDYASYDDKKELQDYLKFLMTVWRECKKKLCKGGRIAVNIADTWRNPYIPLHCHITEQFLDLGFLMRGVIYWDKGASVGVSTAWGSWRSASNPTLRDVGEYIMVFSKDDFRLVNDSKISTITPEQFTTYTKSLWSFPTTSPEKEGHPAPFPEELPKRLILLYTFLGDKVLDPFLGSGTTCKVAKALGRRSVGYEIDENYRPTIEAKIGKVESVSLTLDAFTGNSSKTHPMPIAVRSEMKDSI